MRGKAWAGPKVDRGSDGSVPSQKVPDASASNRSVRQKTALYSSTSLSLREVPAQA